MRSVLTRFARPATKLTTRPSPVFSRAMATATTVQLDTKEHPAYRLPNISQEQAKKASDLLQENHDSYHIFFNRDGFHNHIAHHLLTTYALSASLDDLQRHYDTNKTYQRAPEPLRQKVLQELSDEGKFKSYLGKEQYYHDFLVFFQGEMEKASAWMDVVNKYLFSRTELADDMLARLFGGFLHPLIHLGFGIEFSQPAIAAEALAQTAVHANYMERFFKPAEAAANKNRSEPSKPLATLLDEIHDDPELRASVKFSDGNKLRDGVIARAGEQMVSYTSQYYVAPSELEEKTAEMLNAAAYFTGGAQRPNRQIKYDFFYMHSVNCGIFFSSILKQGWMSSESKCRLLEWKIWGDLALYVSRGCPDIRMDEIGGYKPKQASGWEGVIERVRSLDDDGHASKLVRALAHGQEVCAPYEQKNAFRLKQVDWLQLGHMAIDSVEAGEPHWVRSAGFDEAWEKIPLRA